jgi:hypothetical protein
LYFFNSKHLELHPNLLSYSIFRKKHSMKKQIIIAIVFSYAILSAWDVHGRQSLTVGVGGGSALLEVSGLYGGVRAYRLGPSATRELKAGVRSY